eukprot:scaffold3298_cov17-Tisochrysis_lutea.AAC.1
MGHYTSHRESPASCSSPAGRPLVYTSTFVWINRFAAPLIDPWDISASGHQGYKMSGFIDAMGFNLRPGNWLLGLLDCAKGYKGWLTSPKLLL